MTFKVPADLSRVSDEELSNLLTEGETAFNALTGAEIPSDADVAEAERLHPQVEQLRAETERRSGAVASRKERMAALATKNTPVTEPVVEAAVETPATPVVEPVVTETAPVVEAAVIVYAEDLVQAATESDTEFASRKGRYPAKVAAAVVPAAPAVEVIPAPTFNSVAVVAAQTERPARPARATGVVALTAAADVPGFSTGSDLAGMANVATATINRMKGFPTPHGDGMSEDLRQFGVATFTKPFPEELIINQTSDDYSIVNAAAKESRLPGGSLTAAGGWCSPSETIYDLCENESTEGILPIPEVQVNRGGIRTTLGPDWADIYSAVGFSQTETQAIAGTTKACYDITCPSFTDVRLDAVGLCIRVPILTNAAYPELVQRIIRGALVAHQHKVNAKVIAALSTALGTAVVGPNKLGTVESTLTAVELAITGMRNRYRMSFGQTAEVVLPAWTKGALRSDFSLRNGMETEVVTDGVLAEHFAARGASLHFVYDWQDLSAACPTAYPSTFDMLVYPAGAFVKGTSSIISLNAVYDAASLAVNTFTGLFFEEGVLVTRTCYGGCKYTITVANNGVTGAATLGGIAPA